MRRVKRNIRIEEKQENFSKKCYIQNYKRKLIGEIKIKKK